MPVMSAADFRAAVQQQLRDDGVFDDITAAVRARLVRSLLDENPQTPARANRSDRELALLSLVYHHLDDQGLHGAVSVLCAESKLETSPTFPWGFARALKALGLESVWEQFAAADGNPSTGVLPFLDWFARTKLPSIERTSTRVSRSAQTEKEAGLSTENVDSEHNKENASVN